jgi:hypothetical protein
LGLNFNFERAPLKLQRSIKTKKKYNNDEEKEEGKIEGGALGRLWKKQKSQGQCDFLKPNEKHIRKNVQRSESPEIFCFVGSLNLFRAVHRVEWTGKFGKIEK